MNERQYVGNLIRAGRSHCAWLELALATRSLIVSGTGQKALPGPREPCIIQRACLQKKRGWGREGESEREERKKKEEEGTAGWKRWRVKRAQCHPAAVPVRSAAGTEWRSVPRLLRLVCFTLRPLVQRLRFHRGESWERRTQRGKKQWSAGRFHVFLLYRYN